MVSWIDLFLLSYRLVFLFLSGKLKGFLVTPNSPALQLIWYLVNNTLTNKLPLYKVAVFFKKNLGIDELLQNSFTILIDLNLFKKIFLYKLVVI